MSSGMRHSLNSPQLVDNVSRYRPSARVTVSAHKPLTGKSVLLMLLIRPVNAHAGSSGDGYVLRKQHCPCRAAGPAIETGTRPDLVNQPVDNLPGLDQTCGQCGLVAPR